MGNTRVRGTPGQCLGTAAPDVGTCRGHLQSSKNGKATSLKSSSYHGLRLQGGESDQICFTCSQISSCSILHNSNFFSAQGPRVQTGSKRCFQAKHLGFCCRGRDSQGLQGKAEYILAVNKTQEKDLSGRTSRGL